MKDALIWLGIVAAYAVVLAVFVMWYRRQDTIWHRKLAEQEAERKAEHQGQMEELARQRHLRELEERRRGLLRGRDHACRFCGVNEGCLSADDLCLEVEACFERAGAPTGATSGTPV